MGAGVGGAERVGWRGQVDGVLGRVRRDRGRIVERHGDGVSYGLGIDGRRR
jgi:hypothetical protein